MLDALQQEEASIWLEQAIQIQRSLGVQRGKSDPVDARRIALYAYKNRQEARLWVPRREAAEQLKGLLILRERFLNTLSRLRKPIEELKSHGNPRMAKLIEDSSQGSIEGARKDLASIEARIDELFSKDAELSRLYELISSVDGVGKCIAGQVIVDTNEFKKIKEGKAYACSSGVVPFEHRSGSIVQGEKSATAFLLVGSSKTDAGNSFANSPRILPDLHLCIFLLMTNDRFSDI